MADIKRLNLDIVTSNDDKTSRLVKGIGREFDTPKGWIPYSQEGSTFFSRVDKPIFQAFVQNRLEAVRIIESYPNTKLKSYDYEIESYTKVTQIFTITKENQEVSGVIEI